MAYENVDCPLCGDTGKSRCLEPPHNAVCEYSQCGCPRYYSKELDWRTRLRNLPNSQDRLKIRALLREREVKGLRPAYLQFPSQEYREIGEGVRVPVDELLATWPDNVPERIERSFCNLVTHYSSSRSPNPGYELRLDRDSARDRLLLFTDDNAGEEFFLNAMYAYCWIAKRREGRFWQLLITPTGWAKFDELTRTQSHTKNPAFVAMSFGGNDPDPMSRLFSEVIEPAINKAGYRAKRADTDEHNEPIIDRIVADIRTAPFVVAELTHDNRGVYYEAGFARGLGTEVIYCCQDGDNIKPHFDVSGVNHVRWKDETDLRKKLENRILGTLGRGPHKFEDGKRDRESN